MMIRALVGAGAPGLSTPCGELQPKPRHMLLNGSIGTSARAGCTMPNAAAPAIWRRVSCSASVQGRSAAARTVIDLRILDTAVFAQLSVTASSGRAMYGDLCLLIVGSSAS